MYKLICATFVCLLLALSGYAQTVDTAILGNVTDAAQEAVPNATVTITQPSTGLTRVVTTSNSGAYDLSLRKAFAMPFGESQRLEFRAEAFNAFNTPQFANPDNGLGDGAFGQVTSTKLANRELQLALKYYF
jgi:hypothetical protein